MQICQTQTHRTRIFGKGYGLRYYHAFRGEKYPKTAIATFYQQRWHIELNIRAIKTHMGIEFLRCKTPEMVEKEITVQVLTYNIIRGNLAQTAILHDKTLRQLSFRSAVQLVIQATKQLIVLTDILLNNAMHALF
jgi:hypothetical protein